MTTRARRAEARLNQHKDMAASKDAAMFIFGDTMRDRFGRDAVSPVGTLSPLLTPPAAAYMIRLYSSAGPVRPRSGNGRNDREMDGR